MVVVDFSSLVRVRASRTHESLCSGTEKEALRSLDENKSGKIGLTFTADLRLFANYHGLKRYLVAS